MTKNFLYFFQICATLFVTATFFTTTFAYQLKYFYQNDNDLLHRRQDLGYSANIVHEDPKHPDEVSAQSSINVNFNPKKINSPPTENYPTVRSTNAAFRQNKQIPQPDTQLFNVGYSVTFKNGPNENKQTKRQQILDNGEIITGTRKRNEQVDAPQDFSVQSRQIQQIGISERKHKISGIKPKPNQNQFQTGANTKQLVNSANLTPATQKQLKQLENVQPQFMLQKQVHDNFAWRNLGPDVEIVRSSEIPIGNNLKSNGQSFNHEKALGRSESFDFTNALDNNVGELKGTTQKFVLEKADPTPITNLIQPTTNYVPISTQTQNIDVPVQQYFGNGIKLMSTNGGPAPKFPVDMSLLRDPIITTDLKHVPENPNVIPIHFDIRPIQEAVKSHLVHSNGQQQLPIQYQPIVYNPQMGQNHLYQPNPVYQPNYVPDNGPKMPTKPHQNQHQPASFKYTKNLPQKQIKTVYIKQYNSNEKYHRQPRHNLREDLSTVLRPPPMTNPNYHQKILLSRSYF